MKIFQTGVRVQNTTHAVMRGVALTLASTGNSSAFIAHGRGPKPNEKAAM